MMNEYIRHYVPVRHAYLRDDIKNVLAAVAVAAAGGQRSTEYEAGFADALRAVAIGLGMVAPNKQADQGSAE